MKHGRRAVGATSALAAVLLLSGCSLDTVIWGPEGAAVIDTTEQLLAAASAGDAASFVCAEEEPDLRAPEDWRGLSAEEPERFVPEYWPDQASLDPAWSINLSLGTYPLSVGEEYPGDVFCRETGDGLCLVDVVWWTVEG